MPPVSARRGSRGRREPERAAARRRGRRRGGRRSGGVSGQGMREPQQLGLAAVAADELQPDRQPVAP